MALYIIVGFLLVLYLSIIGKAVQVYFKPFHSLNAFLSGLFYTLITYGVLFHFTQHVEGFNYKVLFIIYFALNIIGASYINIREKQVNRKDFILFPVLVVMLITLYVNVKVWNYTATLSSDYQTLYWSLVSKASEFISGPGVFSNGGNASEGYIYFLSNFYRFIGNFIGMFYALPGTFVFKDQLPMYEYGIVSFIFTSAIIYSVVGLLLSAFKKDNKQWLLFIVISPIVFFANPYFVTAMGSRMMIIPVVIIFVDVINNKFSFMKWNTLIVGWMFWTSSTIFLIPLVILISLMFKEKMNRKEQGVLLFSILPLSIVASTTGMYLLLVIMAAVVAYEFIYKHLIKLNDLVLNVVQSKYMWLIIFILPFSVMFVDYIKLYIDGYDSHTGRSVQKWFSYFGLSTIFWLAMISLLFTLNKTNKNIVKFVASSAFLANGIVFFVMSLMSEAFGIVAHRMNTFIFFDDFDTHNNVVWIAATFALVLVVDKVKFFRNK